MTPNFRDVFFLAPDIVLDGLGACGFARGSGLARRQAPAIRRRTDRLCWRWPGVGVALAAALVVWFVPLMVRAYPQEEYSWLSPQDVSYLSEADPVRLLRHARRATYRRRSSTSCTSPCWA